MDSITSKLDLMEKGTRYQHYYELKEVFLLGIDVIDRMNQSHISEMDIEMKRKLTTAKQALHGPKRGRSETPNKAA